MKNNFAKVTFSVQDIEGTKIIAKAFAEKVLPMAKKKKIRISLEGDIGIGKTHFAKYFMEEISGVEVNLSRYDVFTAHFNGLRLREYDAAGIIFEDKIKKDPTIALYDDIEVVENTDELDHYDFDFVVTMGKEDFSKENSREITFLQGCEF